MCNSETSYPKWLEDGIQFILFPNLMGVWRSVVALLNKS